MIEVAFAREVVVECIIRIPHFIGDGVVTRYGKIRDCFSLGILLA